MATETDNLLDDVRAAADLIESNAPAPEPAPIAEPDDSEAPPVDETPAERTERERDEAGRFKAKDPNEKPRETLTLKNPPEKALAAATGQTTAQTEQQQTGKPEPIPPPLEWKGAAKVRWDRIAPEIQHELKGLYETAAAERAELAPLKELLDVNREHLVRESGSVAEGIRQLLAFEKLSRDNPLGLIQHIAQARGINLQQALVGGTATPQTQQPRDVEALIARAVDQRLQPILAQSEQRETHQTLSAIESFRADPKHPYFNDVVDSMADLIAAAKSRGQTMDLETAYQKAVRLDDAIFERIQSDAREAKAEEAKQKAEKARRAAGASLRGSPLPGYSPNSGGQGATTLDDARAAAAEVWGD